MSNVIIGDILPYTQAVAILNQTVFGTNWTADVASNVVVYQTPFGQQPSDELFKLNFPADYSVAFIGALLQVQVTLVTPAGAGDIITITRQTPADRLNEYTNTNFTPSMLNNDFEILTLVDQQAQLVDQLIGPRYNYSAIIAPNFSFPNANIILPILLPNQVWVKNNADTEIIGLDVPSSGFAPADASYVLLTPDSTLLPNSFALSSLGAGLLVNNPSGTNILVTTVAGTTNQINVINGSGVGGNVTVSITDNPIIPGTAGMGIPIGTTAQRVIPLSNINLRYNTDLEAPEFWNGSTWVEIAGADIITPGAINDLAYYAAAGTTLSPLATSIDGVLITSHIGAPNWLANSGTPGFVLTANAGAPPSWQNASASGAITTIDGDAGSVTPTAGVVTISGGATGLTTSGSVSTLTLTGTLAIAHGGTGVTSVTTAPTATAWAGWDANKNFSANSFISGYTTTATAGAVTTLDITSTYQQFFTGATTQTVVMPVTSTLVLGQQYLIVNNSSGNVTVNSSGGNNIVTLGTNTLARLTVILTSGTTAASWYYDFVNKVESAGTVTSISAADSTVTLTPNPIVTTGTIAVNTATFVRTVKVQTFTSSGTYTPSTGMLYCTVEGVGGGGGSAGVSYTLGQGAASGGGGGGGYTRTTLSASVVGASQTVTVGAGGVAGTNAPGNGGNGGDTSFGAIVTAGGGTGSIATTSTTGPSTCAGIGSGGVNSGSIDFAITGGAGGYGWWLAAGTLATAGAGGNSFLGQGGALLSQPANNAFNGFAGGNYGGGAGGAVGPASATSTQPGSAGAQGIVIITEYISA